MVNAYVKSLHIYPIKSARGIDLQTTDVRRRGLRGDRRFMVVDKGGQFITQRQNPELAQLNVKVMDLGLDLSWPAHDTISVKLPQRQNRKPVTVWRDTIEAAVANETVNEALSDWLGKTVSLVFMDADSERTANPAWTETPSPVSFADGYPILVTNTASLADLNTHIIEGGEEAVPMLRFRPNIVIDTDVPWDEDAWTSLQIGDVALDLVKPCARCVITTLDQDSGEKQGREPLRSLKRLRTSNDPRNGGVLFGMNAVVRTMGVISTGDRVKLT